MIEVKQHIHGDSITTIYKGTKKSLICAGVVTESMFPAKASYRKTSKRSHPESGHWYITQLVDELWSVYYYSDLDQVENYPFCQTDEQEAIVKAYVERCNIRQHISHVPFSSEAAISIGQRMFRAYGYAFMKTKDNG